MSALVRASVFFAACFAASSALAQPATEVPVQLGLAALVVPRVPELRAAGIQKIIARTGQGRRDVQVISQYGASYFAWPKGPTPTPFEIYLDAEGKVGAFANDFSDATKPRFAAALDAILPLAIRAANQARANATRPKA